MPVIRDPDFIDYGEYDVNSPPLDPYTASKNNSGQPAQLLIDYDDRKFALTCLLYTSPSPRDMRRSRMPSSA